MWLDHDGDRWSSVPRGPGLGVTPAKTEEVAQVKMGQNEAPEGDQGLGWKKEQLRPKGGEGLRTGGDEAVGTVHTKGRWETTSGLPVGGREL